MVIDLNNLSAFISNCDNDKWLIDHYNHVADRLGALGVPAAKIESQPLDTAMFKTKPKPTPVTEVVVFPEPAEPAPLSLSKIEPVKEPSQPSEYFDNFPPELAARLRAAHQQRENKP